jgi:hypothetical protein
MKRDDSFSRQTRESNESLSLGGAHIGRLRYLVSVRAEGNQGAKPADLAGASRSTGGRFRFHDCVAEQSISHLMGICFSC